MSCATGLLRRCAAESHRMPWCPSIVIPFPLSSPRACAVTTNAWGVVDDGAGAGLDLGITSLDGGSVPAAGYRHRRAPLELSARADEMVRKSVLRDLERAGLHGLGADP